MNSHHRILDILYVGPLPPHNGGTATVGSLILSGLAQKGHRIRALAPGLRTQTGINDRYARSHPEIQMQRFTVPYFESSPDVSPSDHYRNNEKHQIHTLLRYLISEKQPDLVLIGRETFALHVPDIARKHLIPTVLLIHGTTIAGIQNKTIPEETAQRLLQEFHKADLVISVARNLADSGRVLGLDRIQVIENAIDEKMFHPAPKDKSLMEHCGISGNQTVVAHISNMKRLKRTEDLLHAAKRALIQNPELVFLIVGDGNLRPNIEESCRQMGMQKSFRFTGWVEYDRIPDFLNLSDMVVMPSQSEARAMVFLETQACGRLLIASNIPSAREVIDDGETGLLFSVANIEEMTGKILYAANHPEIREEIGRNARRAALNRPLQLFVDQYETAIQEVVAKYQPSLP